MRSQKKVEIRQGSFRIERFFPEPIPLKLHPKLFKFSNVCTWGLWVVYNVFQFLFACSVQIDARNFLWRMWIVLWAEMALSIQQAVVALNIIFSLYAANEARTRPSYRLMGSSAPTVDIFITCCGEPTDVVLDTIAAAAAQDYPPKQFRIFVLDDSYDELLRKAIMVFNRKSAEKTGHQVGYLSRQLAPGVKSYFKAGNLQFGIEETQRLGGSAYLASLDADMISEPGWLRMMVPHLILEDALAVECPTPSYYNVPDGDILCQQAELDISSAVLEPLNDRLDVGMCTGTGFVARRSALLDIGGWPLLDAGEDVMCSALLINAGWKSAFIRGHTQSGLAPDSLRAHVKQRVRWADCAIELHKQFGFYLPGSKITSHVAWTQRGVGVLQALRDYAPVTNILALILLPVAIFPVPNDEFNTIASEHDLFWLRSIFLIAFVAQKVNDYIVYGHVGLRQLASYRSMDIWCATYTATRCILSFFPSTANHLRFEPTGCIISPANERSRLHRKPLIQRLLSLDLFMYLIYVIYASTPLLLRSLAYVNADPSSGSRLFFPFLGPILRLLHCVWMASVPLRYMLNPPTVPEREELMEMDEAKVRRPKQKQTHLSGEDTGWPWTDVCEICFICWCYLR